MSEKLNRQKNADEKKMIVAQHREKPLEYERKRLTRNERAYWLSFFRRFSQSVVKNRRSWLAAFCCGQLFRRRRAEGAALCWGQGAKPIGRLRAAAIIGSRTKCLGRLRAAAPSGQG